MSVGGQNSDIERLVPLEKGRVNPFTGPTQGGKFANQLLSQPAKFNLVPVVAQTPAGPMTGLQIVPVPTQQPVQNPTIGTGYANRMLKPNTGVNPVNPLRLS